MAAATMTAPIVKKGATQDVVMQLDFSSMTDGQLETVSHGGPSGVRPYQITCETTLRSAAGDLVLMEHVRASDDTTNDTVTLRFTASGGGNLTDATARVLVYFDSHKSGGKVT